MFKKLLDLVQHHGFIASTSVAMFVHSTWTFNTLFAGEQPIPTDLLSWLMYAKWVLPGALIALAIDVGQIQTSGKIKKTRGWVQFRLVVTFAMLALAGYYLQWFHMAHHLPALSLGEGLSVEHVSNVEMLKGLAIWIIPALLPMATILYTISDVDDAPPVVADLPSVDLNHMSILNSAPLPSMNWIKADVDAFDPEEDDTEPIEPVVNGGYGQLDTSPELQSERAKKPRRRKGNGSA